MKASADIRGHAYQRGDYLPQSSARTPQGHVEHFWSRRGGLVSVTLPCGMVFASSYQRPVQANGAEACAVERAVRWTTAGLVAAEGGAL